MHIKGAFKEDVIPFFKNLRESFKHFEMGLYKEVNEMKAIFKQMEDKVDQCSVEKKYFEIEKKQLLINNDQLLEDNISIVLWYLDSGCSKHTTGQRDNLINFISKFIDTVRSSNDHFASIMGYEDLQFGNVLIS
nr:retrovirus-related Pol polyprotein from transposon TNT 1-94 [Tanacetum cinerariifolium]